MPICFDNDTKFVAFSLLHLAICMANDCTYCMQYTADGDRCGLI